MIITFIFIAGCTYNDIQYLLYLTLSLYLSVFKPVVFSLYEVLYINCRQQKGTTVLHMHLSLPFTNSSEDGTILQQYDFSVQDMDSYRRRRRIFGCTYCASQKPLLTLTSIVTLELYYHKVWRHNTLQIIGINDDLQIWEENCDF